MSNGKTETETLIIILDSLKCFHMSMRGKLMKPIPPPWLLAKNEEMVRNNLPKICSN